MSYQVINPFIQFVDPINGKPLSGGSVYFGRQDTDPKNQPANRISVYAVQDNGTEVLLAQPITLNGAGQPQYSGSVKQLKVETYTGESAYCVQVFSSSGSQKGYSSRVYSLLDLQALAAVNSTVVIAGMQAQTIVKRISSFVTPEEYGLVEGADAGNTAKAVAMISAGKQILWGSKSYGFTSPILITTPVSIDWDSAGCTLYAAFGGHESKFISIAVLPKKHVITGTMTIDASSVANEAFRLYNSLPATYPTNYAAIVADNVTIKNAKRISAASGDAAGWTIRGAFSSVVLNNPVVSNIRMAAGSGVPSSIGAYGIGVDRDPTGGYALSTEINNPRIDGVYCEDPTYTSDMDGILVFGGLLASDMVSYFEVNGGRIANCNGRSVKGQTTSGKVSGTTLYRDTGITGGYGLNPDIDFQLGNGFVDGIICEYRGFVPTTIVSQQTSGVESPQFGNVDGIQYTVSGGVTLPAVVSNVNRLNQSGALSINAISGTGATTTVVLARTPDDEMSVNVDNITVDNVVDAIVTVVEGGGSVTAPFVVYVNMSNVVNRGAAVAAVKSNFSTSPSEAILSVSGKCIGVTQTNRMQKAASNKPLVMRSEGFAGTYAFGGFQKVYSVEVASGDTVFLPQFGYSLNYYLLAIRVNDGRQAGALLSCDDGGVLSLSSGTLVNVGTTSEPATGTYRLWYSSADSAVAFKNTSGSEKVLTVLMLG